MGVIQKQLRCSRIVAMFLYLLRFFRSRCVFCVNEGIVDKWSTRHEFV